MKIKISNQFNGPNQSGNGGYVCGIIDFHSPFTVSEVTLKMPPPLNKDLFLQYEPDRLALMDEDKVIAFARKAKLDLDIPEPPSFEIAQEATKTFIGNNDQHIFPHCFVCGPKRSPGDGLRIFPGKIEGAEVYAASWIPETFLGDDRGIVKKEFIWSALDCPGAFALMGDTMQAMVLGRMICKFQVATSLRVGEKAVVIGWPIEKNGRKMYCGTAVFNEAMKVVAYAKATWISVELPKFASN